MVIMMRVFQPLIWVAKYISNLVAWFWRTQPFIAIFAAMTIVALLFVVFNSCFERQIRLSGMGLQLLGVILVGVGLRDTRRAFENQPTMWKAIKLWWSGRPRFGPQHQTIHVTGVQGLSLVGSARARVGPGPNTTLEQRVAMLEQQYVGLFDELGTLSSEIKVKLDELSDSLQAERSERQQAEVQAKNQLERAVAEGIPLARVGVIVFLIGITAGTASAEIASIFGAGACQ
jgi:hypothetical protein